MASSQTPVRTLIWNWPLRVFHWSLVGLVFTLWLSGEQEWMDVHRYCGIAVIGLVVFRIGWGFLGGPHATFWSFIPSPMAVWRYLRTLGARNSPPSAGHNPLGGLSVLALLAALLVQGGSGLFATDDVMVEGPLMQFVSLDTAEWLTGIHHQSFDVLTVLIGLHVAAILFYWFRKRQNLVWPMVTGYKSLEAVSARTSAWRLILALVPAVAVVVALLSV